MIGRALSACKVLDDDVLMLYADKITEALHNMTTNDRFDTDTV